MGARRRALLPHAFRALMLHPVYSPSGRSVRALGRALECPPPHLDLVPPRHPTGLRLGPLGDSPLRGALPRQPRVGVPPAQVQRHPPPACPSGANAVRPGQFRVRRLASPGSRSASQSPATPPAGGAIPPPNAKTGTWLETIIALAFVSFVVVLCHIAWSGTVGKQLLRVFRPCLPADSLRCPLRPAACRLPCHYPLPTCRSLLPLWRGGGVVFQDRFLVAGEQLLEAFGGLGAG